MCPAYMLNSCWYVLLKRVYDVKRQDTLIFVLDLILSWKNEQY